jgi:hypothetical protein
MQTNNIHQPRVPLARTSSKMVPQKGNMTQILPFSYNKNKIPRVSHEESLAGIQKLHQRHLQRGNAASECHWCQPPPHAAGLVFHQYFHSQLGMTGQPCSPLTQTTPLKESMTHNNKPTGLQPNLEEHIQCYVTHITYYREAWNQTMLPLGVSGGMLPAWGATRCEAKPKMPVWPSGHDIMLGEGDNTHFITPPSS